MKKEIKIMMVFLCNFVHKKENNSQLSQIIHSECGHMSSKEKLMGFLFKQQMKFQNDQDERRNHYEKLKFENQMKWQNLMLSAFNKEN